MYRKTDTKNGLYLVQNIQGDGIEEVFHNDPEYRALGSSSSHARHICWNGHASHPTAMQSTDRLQSCLGTLRDRERNFLTRVYGHK